MARVEEVSTLLNLWEEASVSQGREVVGVLKRLAEVFEAETEAFLKQDPDPFDDRHPSRSQPDCTLGHMLKTVFRNDRIVDELVKNYCMQDNEELNTVVCRLLLDILPGLENVIFQEEGFVPRLLQWVESASNPLQSYATGLLAAAMDVPEIAANHREKNNYFVPLMIQRLRELSKQYLRNPSPPPEEDNSFVRPFAQFSTKIDGVPMKAEDCKISKRGSRRKKDYSRSSLRFNPISSESKRERKSSVKMSPVSPPICHTEGSNSSWIELESYVIGSHQVYPLTLAAQQRYVLQYLTPMGEYQDLIGHVFEQNTLPLILRYVDLKQNRDVRLAFEALKYLASLLCPKKIAIEFLNIGGLQLLLKVPRPSIAATGVSICIYYLSYIEEVMEKICMLPTTVISELVTIAVWLLECSHDSSRCHATMFFGFAFAFRIILTQFDKQDGLRKLFNVVSTLDVFVHAASGQNLPRPLSDDQIWADRQTTRHVCATLKRYFEAHLIEKVEQIRLLQSGKMNMSVSSDNKSYKSNSAVSLTPETIEHHLNRLHEEGVIPIDKWKPVDEFLHLDGVSFLLELIFTYFDLSYSGRLDTVKCALDVLKLCSLTDRTQLAFCEKISSPEYLHVTGMSILLTAAEGELMLIPDIQKSALMIIINCVCSKLPKVSDSTRNSLVIGQRKKSIRTMEDHLNKMYKGVRTKNGINILINLLSIKTPLTDADCIRTLACKALCGLARSETVKQIISKLPLVTDGQLLDLMKEPVLHDKCQYHVQFCKLGLELIQQVTGAPATPTSGSSMLNINKSEVVSKTEVVYHQNQLIQLISDHLSLKGYTETVECLQREMAERSVPAASWVPDNFPVTNPSSFVSVLNQEKSSSSSLALTPMSSKQRSIFSRRIVLRKNATSDKVLTPSCRLQKPQACSGNYVQSPAMKRQAASSYIPYGSSQTVGLHSIVTEYLRKQHSLCKHPMLACPPFDLFNPHKCPEPHGRRNAPTNCALRLPKRAVSPPDGGYGGSALNRKLIYGRYRLVRTFRAEDARCDFLTCSFLKYNSEFPHPRILVGTLNGDLKVFNVNTAQEELSRECHRVRGVAHIESRETTPIVITSDGGRIGNSSLWNSDDNFEFMHNFIEISHLEFGKRSIERLVGSRQYSTSILDTATFAELQNFTHNNLGNGYTRNRATFDYNDELVLSDGLIWDIRSGKMIHKLDKFNSTENGIFHPNGREIISNSEIWDIRTFKLLRTVNTLDQTKICFNPPGTVMYGVHLYPPIPRDVKNEDNANTFAVYDAYDYSSIATVEVRKPVFQLTSDLNDRYIAIIENQTLSMAEHLLAPVIGVDCICKLYEIGRTKEEGDDGEEESDDSEEGTEGDDDDEDDNNDTRNEEDNDDQDDTNWVTTSDSGGDDDDDEDDDDDIEDVLFALNPSAEE
ncbi:LOW QUALITY PROTEIN: DDB1- and CUL4-associated factor 1-like [Uloborus diversus]|uniref:LOW QUALITY PROTEIN: DDB1- and CUL4-associated factor 1-like n=1 Tax=Uloborus diversus TaxID=327109 RepID=UPI00240A8685|nr:LOW QUALITY PROTEIN: DDB1- and CUL4-associated factor 1-like [Uloborus diversus]